MTFIKWLVIRCIFWTLLSLAMFGDVKGAFNIIEAWIVVDFVTTTVGFVLFASKPNEFPSKKAPCPGWFGKPLALVVVAILFWFGHPVLASLNLLSDIFLWVLRDAAKKLARDEAILEAAGKLQKTA